MSWRRNAGLYLLACLGLGLVCAAALAASGGAGWSNALLLVVPATPVYGVSAGFSAYYLCRAWPLRARHPGAVVAVMGAASLCSGALLLVLLRAWNALNLLAGVPWAGVDLGPTLAALVVGAGAMLYGLAAAVCYLLAEFVRAQAAERRGLEARLAAQQAELRLLRAQIDPHFLFNSLHSISALTAIAPEAARDMTLRLAGFFRRSLGLAAQGQVTLAEEMTLVGDFLAIEKVRFGDRLGIEEAVGTGAADCLLPPMLIQPLVENAVKHGIRHLTDGGTVCIAAARAGAQLRIVVSNSVDRDAVDRSGAQGTGLGLANVRQRLAAAYGHEAGLHWRREADTFIVELTLPAATAAAPSTQGEPT